MSLRKMFKVLDESFHRADDRAVSFSAMHGAVDNVLAHEEVRGMAQAIFAGDSSALEKAQDFDAEFHGKLHQAVGFVKSAAALEKSGVLKNKLSDVKSGFFADKGLETDVGANKAKVMSNEFKEELANSPLRLA